MGIVAGRLDLVTDQHSEFARVWPLRDKETQAPIVGLDVASARLLAKNNAGDELEIPVVYEEVASPFTGGDPTGTFSFDESAATMTIDGNFTYDVRVVPSTGDADAWYLFEGVLTVRKRHP